MTRHPARRRCTNTALQLVAVVHATGEAFGLVLDSRPMTAAQEAAHTRSGGCRCPDGASAHAAGLARRYRSDVTVAELVHHPEHVGHAGGHTRRLSARTFYRVVATAAHVSTDTDAASAA